MGIMLRVIRSLFFVAVILALGQTEVKGKAVGAHLVSAVTAAWKAGPQPWIRQGAAAVPSESIRRWLEKAGISSSPSEPRRPKKAKPIVDDIAERDRARLRTLLEKESL
jgi:hypothetical protein